MISIIIAVYNGEKYIEETINSALAQSVQIEVIVIDDCSNDNSLKVVQEMAKKNSLIKVMKNDENLGFCKSVNKGIKIAQGNYVLVLGQDDIISSDHCEKMKKYFLDDVSIVFCDYDLIDQNGKVYDIENHCEHTDKKIKDFYKSNVIPSVGLLMNKQILISVGGYPENNKFPQYGEYHTWIRLALEGRVVFCNEVRAKYRRHATNMTNNFEDKAIKKKLNQYYNTCVSQFFKSSKINLFDKGYIFLYMHYRSLKVLL